MPSAANAASPLRRGLPRDLAAVAVPTLILVFARSLDNNTLFLVSMMIYIALAQGVNVIYGFTGYLPFGYVGFFGAGAYGAYIAVVHLHTGAGLAMLLGGGAAALIAVLLIPLLRLRGAYFAIASLAAALGLAALVSNPSLTSLTNGPYGGQLGRIFNVDASYYSAVALVSTTILAVVALRRSRLGLALRAVRADQQAASMAGVNVVAVRTAAWMIAALFAGFAGAIYAWAISTFYPDAVFSTNISLFAIVFALFGGIGTTLGPVLGAALLYYLYDLIGISQPQYFQLIYGLLIVAVALLLPGGLVALLRQSFDQITRSRRASGASDGAPGPLVTEPSVAAGQGVQQQANPRLRLGSDE